jgi:hypothetical protein
VRSFNGGRQAGGLRERLRELTEQLGGVLFFAEEAVMETLPVVLRNSLLSD